MDVCVHFWQNGKHWADPMDPFLLQRYETLKKNHNAAPGREEAREESMGSGNEEKPKPDL